MQYLVILLLKDFIILYCGLGNWELSQKQTFYHCFQHCYEIRNRFPPNLLRIVQTIYFAWQFTKLNLQVGRLKNSFSHNICCWLFYFAVSRSSCWFVHPEVHGGDTSVSQLEPTGGGQLLKNNRSFVQKKNTPLFSKNYWGNTPHQDHHTMRNLGTCYLIQLHSFLHMV